MHEKVYLNIEKIGELLNELNIYSSYREKLVSETEEIDRRYQKGKLEYLEYERLKKHLLKGKEKSEWLDYYNSYIYSLLKQIEQLLSRTFYVIYTDNSFGKLQIQEPSIAEQSIELIKRMEHAKAAKPETAGKAKDAMNEAGEVVKHSIKEFAGRVKKDLEHIEKETGRAIRKEEKKFEKRMKIYLKAFIQTIISIITWPFRKIAVSLYLLRKRMAESRKNRAEARHKLKVEAEKRKKLETIKAKKRKELGIKIRKAAIAERSLRFRNILILPFVTIPARIAESIQHYMRLWKVRRGAPYEA